MHFLITVGLIAVAGGAGVIFSANAKSAVESLEAKFEARMASLEAAVKAKL